MIEELSLWGETKDEVLTEEAISKKSIKGIFHRWYWTYYKNKETGEVFYAQSAKMIYKEIKSCIDKGADPFYLEWAINLLGMDKQIINNVNIQKALAYIRKYEVDSKQ